MQVPKVSDIAGILNRLAPPKLAEEWDNPGLQAGLPAAPASRILVALDVTPAVINEALSRGCTLLVTHHPLFLKPLRKLDLSDPFFAPAAKALTNGLAVFSAHTNYDSAPEGLNDLLARRLGIIAAAPLRVSRSAELVKLAVFVPQGHEDTVLRALFPFSGAIGNYADCSFRAPGVGTFRPLEGANPFLGHVGELEQAQEVRVEVLLRAEDQAAAIAALRRAHPYEEPAYDLYPLLNRGVEFGLGRVGKLAEETTLAAFAASVAAALECRSLRYVGNPDRRVRKVAVCSGSGASLLREAARAGADVLVTGDVKYHDARDAELLGLGVVDAGHFATERIAVDDLAGRLREELEKRRFAAEVFPAQAEMDPFLGTVQ